MQFDAVIEKTPKGFGIYFIKVGGDDGFLAVDGFVETDLNDGRSRPKAALHIGDILTRVNGDECRGKKVAEILSLLRTAQMGSNTLSFFRNVSVDGGSGDEVTPTNNIEASDVVDSIHVTPASGFLGTLRKVTDKIRDSNKEELLCEQQENERFERQWLHEFEVLKKQYEVKWETCVYTADEFCGLVYRSSDVKQKEHLLKEYPTLMESWKDARASATLSKTIPEWPTAKIGYEHSAVDGPFNGLETSSTSNAGGTAALRAIHCSRSLQKALECLRVGFMWRSDDLRAFSSRLDAIGISSCSELLKALDAHSCYLERNFQSQEYPRLSRTMLRELRESAQVVVISQTRESW